MPVTIEKTFRFDAGHRCLGFEDCKEAALHGHTWVLRIVIEASERLDSHQTIFDTNRLSRIVKPIVKQLDHSFIVWTEDPICQPLIELCEKANIAGCLHRVDFNPTVEGLVDHLFREVKQRLPLQGAVLKRAELDASATLRASRSD